MGEVLDSVTIDDVVFERVAGRCGGKWVFKNTRMTIQTLVGMARQGAEVSGLVTRYLNYTARQVVAALALPTIVGDERWVAGTEPDEETETGSVIKS